MERAEVYCFEKKTNIRFRFVGSDEINAFVG